MKRHNNRKTVRRNNNKHSFVLGTVLLVLFFVAIGRVGYWDTHYNREAMVISVENNIVTVEDEAGNEWVFVEDGWAVGDEVTLLMHTNTTESDITDDRIISVKLH